MNSERWDSVQLRFPLGAEVEAEVQERFSFGFSVKIVGGDPSLNAVVDLISYCPDGEVGRPDEWPANGEVFRAVVVDHVHHNRQLKLHVGPR